jgi:hypothetical protein
MPVDPAPVPRLNTADRLAVVATSMLLSTAFPMRVLPTIVGVRIVAKFWSPDQIIDPKVLRVSKKRLNQAVVATSVELSPVEGVRQDSVLVKVVGIFWTVGNRM